MLIKLPDDELVFDRLRRRNHTRYTALAVVTLGLLVMAAIVVAWLVYVPSDPVRLRALPERGSTMPAVEPVAFRPIDLKVARKLNQNRPVDATEPLLAAPRFHFPGSDPSRSRAIACLAATGWYEVGDDPLGQQAVMQVVLNRVRHPAFPNTICGVIFQGSERATGCQFTFTCDGSIVRRKPNAAAWRRAVALASSMLSGLVDRRVGVASHYHADWVVPYWAPSLVKLAQVKSHIFYRWPGRWGSTEALLRVPSEAEPRVAALVGLSLAHAELPEPGIAAPLDERPLWPESRAVADARGGDRGLRGALLRSGPSVEGTYLIQIDGGTFAGNHALAALTLCKGRAICRVYAWRNGGDVASSLPLSDGQRKSLSFFYKHEEGKEDQALWNCAQIPRSSKAQCLPDEGPQLSVLID